MNEAQFGQLAEQIFTDIEDAIDQSEAELDYESGNGVLTIDCEDSDTQVIVSRQVAMFQIWVAARSGGFHCEMKDEQWRCTTTEESLKDLLDRVLSEQSDSAVVLDW